MEVIVTSHLSTRGPEEADTQTDGFAVRFGLMHLATFPESLSGFGRFQKTIELAADSGAWDVLELSTDMPRMWDSAVRDLSSGQRLTVFFSAGSEMLRWRDGLNAASAQLRRRAVDRTCALVDRAVEAGAENLQLMSGSVALGGNRFGYLLESLQRVGEHAASFLEQTPTISFETCPSVMLHRQYLGPTPLALWLMETIRRQYPFFRLTLDLAHLVELGEDPGESLAAARGEVHHLHLSCCVLRPGDPRWGDQHPPFGTPGAHPTIQEASRALEIWQSGFEASETHVPAPVITMEVRTSLGEDSVVMHGRCVRAMSRICVGAGLRRMSAA